VLAGLLQKCTFPSAWVKINPCLPAISSKSGAGFSPKVLACIEGVRGRTFVLVVEHDVIGARECRIDEVDSATPNRVNRVSISS